MTDKKPDTTTDAHTPSNVPATSVTAATKSYISSDYATNPKAPVDQWCCAPTSSLGPFTTQPTANTGAPNYCGQCVSYVKVLCPTLPQTSAWAPGDLVKTSTAIVKGTIIANFDSSKKYMGHAAVYVSKDSTGINVYDQWVTGTGKAIGPRKLSYGGTGTSNNGDLFYIVTT